MIGPLSTVTPFVSVVVATRNRANFLDEALRSLAAQTSACEFEVVVVDNASTDGTADLLGRWSRSDARFRAVDESALGLSSARNAGASAAMGDLLLFTDDDVVVGSGWVESYLRFFRQRMDALIVAGGPIIPVPDDLGRWPPWFVHEALDDVGRLDHGAERRLGSLEWLWGANMAMPAQVFRRFGDWDTSLGRRGDERGTFEDTEYQDRLRAGGGEVWFCPNALLHHRIGPDRVRPGYVLTAAYCRGRDLHLIEKVRAGRDASRPTPLPRSVWSMVGRLARLFVAAGAFRALGGPRRFAVARRSAWAAGRSAALVDDRRWLPGRRLLLTAAGRSAGAACRLAGR